ncbi:hypothetical protein ROLI_018130 [Roseobacter fucihabitans]|uniref:Uncharacterized protein n=1 Tax=Roseobacter fucihabitans TaxID=1537242 RepID=A0ABZ2BU54_9RHOB|nr:hypothetical protein [Roseobacter litoralis]MBC6965572.1 hypothetical protein [Roseobacter litoralis]
MTALFFIDALDGDGGLAFASTRGADLLAPSLSGQSRSWRIAAPDFQPEPVGSRAIGLAAATRSFQLGFSLDGESEVGFPTLDALVEFVRRLYLSGGGGDGAAGLGPTPPAGPEGAPPADIEPTTLSEGESDIQNNLARFGELYQARIADLERQGGVQSGAISAAMTFEASWHRDVSELGHEAGLLLEVALLHVAKVLVKTEPPFARRDRANWSQSVGALDAVRRRLGQDNPFEDLSDSSPGPWLKFPMGYGGNQDALDLLSALPIGGFVQMSRAAPNAYHRESWRSVADLFFGCLANPSLLSDCRHPVDRQAIFVLAGILIYDGGRGAYAVLGGTDASLSLGFLMRDVMAWFADQMPTHAFAAPLEDLIQQQGRVTP